ncbi:hypothetical protein WJX77_001814 [Trebouxia sp. C0004]
MGAVSQGRAQGSKLRYYLKDHSQSSFGLCLDWCLSTAPSAVSSDAVLVRQGLFDKAAVFEHFEGNHMMTMQKSWGTDHVIEWKLNTYSWMKCFCCSKAPQFQLVLIEDRTGTEVAPIDGPRSFSMKSSQHCSMTVRNSPGDQASDRCWLRLVIAMGCWQ